MAEEILVRTAKETSDVISHKINARASEIFSEITDGKYRSVNIQKGAGISAWNGMDRISVDRLSEGTLEQIYFFNKNGSVGNAFWKNRCRLF